MRILIWYRNDLRVSDHAALYHACRSGHQVIGVYCFSPSVFNASTGSFPKTGKIRRNFIELCVAELQKNWQNLGSHLLTYASEPEQILPELCRLLQIDQVYVHGEYASEEVKQELRVQQVLSKMNVKLQVVNHTHSLVHQQDLPFKPEQLPDLFTAFRTKTEKQFIVRNTLPIPEKIHAVIPDLNSVALPPTFRFKPEQLPFHSGGEKAAFDRLSYYLWESKRISTYKETRNGLMGTDYSSRLSAWLATGCISARTVYHEIKRYEQIHGSNESTYWLIFELLWRDYFRFVFVKHKHALFTLNGIHAGKMEWMNDESAFEKWRTGCTGYPLVDAFMRELLHTGYMSNRGRQIVASFLTKQFRVNWLWGAQWFESQLIDYDVYSNYGNWAYQAGVGNDARNDRMFNLDKQAAHYDPDGEYVRTWLKK